jgi:putative transposase
LFYKEKSCINQFGIGYNKSINPKRYLKGKRKKIEEFIIDETLIKIGSELIDMALVATIGFQSKQILGINISKERNMLLAERFISSLVGIHGQHPSSFHRWRYLVSTAQACKFLRLPHHTHSPYEKSIIIERTMQYMIKDRTECFDDHFPCRKNDCKLLHVWNRLNLFIGYHNKQLQIVK